MNRLTLRTNVLSRRSWHADVDAAFVAEVNTVCIDGAIKRLASEVPEAFIPDRETVFLLPDSDQDSLTRTVAATTDPYVLDLGVAAGGTSISVDGTLDGIMHIEVTTSGGVTFTRQCREFWLETVGPYAGHYLVSIDTPWRNSTDTGLDFRLFQPYFYLRDNVTQLVDGRIFDSARQILDIVPAGFVRRTDQEDFRGQYKGRPEGFARWEYFQLAAPNRTSVATKDPAAVPVPWIGPEPLGTFTYRYTYVWGKKNFEAAAPGGGYDPQWESAPSPESNSVVVNTLAAVNITGLTNIDFQLGFGTTGTVRDGRSGLQIRIYRARTAVASGGGFEQNIELPGIYFYLATVDGDATTYVDNGSAIPDYHRRLPESRGYYAWSTVPHQDSDYRIDLRVYRRPLALQVDSDAPPIHPDFDDMLEDLVLSRLCELDKSPEQALVYENRYKERLLAYRAKEANPATVIPGKPWRPDNAFRDPSRYRPYTSS
jgi:hypothetical protein